MARFYLILGALVWLAVRRSHADGRVFVVERQNTSESGHEWARQACEERSARLASVADLWHAILECSFSVCTRGWMQGTSVGTTICKSENGAGLRTVDVKMEEDIVEDEERQLDAFCVKDKGSPCGAPPTFPHTLLQSQTGLELGDELLFVCESGHSLASGDASFSLLCDSCGEWYGLVQLCVKDDAEAHVDYEDKFPDGANAYSDSEDGASQAAERGEEEEEEGEEENGETHAEGTSEGTDGDGVTGEGEEGGHTAGGHEEAAGEETDDGNAGSVTDPPVSQLSQKHLFWFPSEAFHDDDHVDTHASDHKHSGVKEAESEVEEDVDQGHHDEDHTAEEKEDNYDDHIKEDLHDDNHGHVVVEHHDNDHTGGEEHHDDDHVEEEHHGDDHAEEEHHVEEGHHDGGLVEEEHHDHDHIEEHHDDDHIEEEHHDDDHIEEHHDDGDHIEEHHDDDHIEEHHDDGLIEEEHHVEEGHHDDGHTEEEHHDDDAEEESPTDEVHEQHTDKSWLDGYPVDEEFTKSTEIGSEEKETTDFSKEAEESVKSTEEYGKGTDSSEETLKGMIDSTDMHPTFFLNVSDFTTALPFLHTSMESLNGDGSDLTTPSGVGPYDMTLDAKATTVVYGSTGTSAPDFFHHASLPTESNDVTAFAEDITSVPFHVTLSPDDITAEDELGTPPALTTILPDDLTSLSSDIPAVLIHDISGVDSDHHNLTKQSMPTEEPCEADTCPSSRSSSLVAIITVGVIVAVVGLALGAWLYRRRQRKSSHYQFNGTNSHTQNFEMQQTV